MSSLPDVILWSAARLVPAEQRAEWLAEWRSELCYLSRSGGRLVPFCLGAFPDALWMKRNLPRTQARKMIRLESPLHCILFLAALAACSVFLAFRLPAVRHTILRPPYRDARNLVLISPPGRYRENVPRVAIEDYRALAAGMGGMFTGVAFYRPVQAAPMSVALASANLFELLDVPISSPVPASVWRRWTWAAAR